MENFNKWIPVQEDDGAIPYIMARLALLSERGKLFNCQPEDFRVANILWANPVSPVIRAHVVHASGDQFILEDSSGSSASFNLHKINKKGN